MFDPLSRPHRQQVLLEKLLLAEQYFSFHPEGYLLRMAVAFAQREHYDLVVKCLSLFQYINQLSDADAAIVAALLELAYSVDSMPPHEDFPQEEEEAEECVPF